MFHAQPGSIAVLFPLTSIPRFSFHNQRRCSDVVEVIRHLALRSMMLCSVLLAANDIPGISLLS